MRCLAAPIATIVLSAFPLRAGEIPTEASVAGVRIARPLAEEQRKLLATSSQSPPHIAKEGFSGVGLLLEATIPAIYGLASEIQVADFSDDSGTNLLVPGCTAAVLNQPKEGAESPARIAITSPKLPGPGARKLGGTLIVPAYPLPAKMFSTMDGQCLKGKIFEAKFVQCQITSREPVRAGEEADGGSLLGRKLGRDSLSFEVSNPGSGSYYAGGSPNRRAQVINRDRIRDNLRIRLLKVEVLDSMGGKVLGGIDGIDPDANKTQSHWVDIPAGTSNVRFRFTYYETDSLVNLQIGFKAGLAGSR